METNQLIEQIQAVTTAEEMSAVTQTIKAMPGKMAPEVQAALMDKLAQFNAQSKAAQDDIISVLQVNGVSYPLTDWLTPANYARQFNIENVATVTNWIKRGIIPAENIKEIPELGLRLVKAVQYSPRAYKASELKDA